MRRWHHPKGFTILELLVVVAIIMILASLLLPVMSGITRNARTMICQSNEKAISAAMLAYASSNQGFLPIPSIIGEQDGQVCWNMITGGTADFTVGTLWPYLAPDPQSRQKIMKCPSDGNECLPRQGDNYFPPGNFSYSLNEQIRVSWARGMPEPPRLALMLRQVKSPSIHGMVFEEFAPNDGLCCGGGDGDDFCTGRHGPYGTTDYREGYYEPQWQASGKANVGFFDGHVATIDTSDYQNNKNNIFSPLDQ